MSARYRLSAISSRVRISQARAGWIVRWARVVNIGWNEGGASDGCGTQASVACRLTTVASR